MLTLQSLVEIASTTHLVQVVREKIILIKVNKIPYVLRVTEWFFLKLSTR